MVLVRLLSPIFNPLDQFLSGCRAVSQVKKVKSAILTGILASFLFGGEHRKRWSSYLCLVYLSASVPHSKSFSGAFRSWFLRSFWKGGEDPSLGDAERSAASSKSKSGSKSAGDASPDSSPGGESRLDRFSQLWDQKQAAEREQKDAFGRALDSTMGGLRASVEGLQSTIARNLQVDVAPPEGSVFAQIAEQTGNISKLVANNLPTGPNLTASSMLQIPGGIQFPAVLGQALASWNNTALPSPVELLDQVQDYETLIVDFLLFKVAVKSRGSFRAVFVGALESWFLLGRPFTARGVCTLVDCEKDNKVLLQLIEDVKKRREA